MSPEVTAPPFTVRGVPARIDREALRIALASLGIDVTAVVAVRFGTESVEFDVLTRVPFPEGSAGQHRILVPIVDGPHEDPLPTVPYGMPGQPFSWTGTPPVAPQIAATWGSAAPPPTLTFPTVPEARP